jgi:hypothetical protein
LYRFEGKLALGHLVAHTKKRLLAETGKSIGQSQPKTTGNTVTDEIFDGFKTSLNMKWLETALHGPAGTMENKVATPVPKWIHDAVIPADPNLHVPLFVSGVEEVDDCEDERLLRGAIQVLYRKGNGGLMFIPHVPVSPIDSIVILVTSYRTVSTISDVICSYFASSR